MDSDTTSTKSNSFLTRILRYGGSCLAVLSLLFFLHALKQSFENKEFYLIVADAPEKCVLAVVTFIVCNALGSFGWRALLQSLGSHLPFLTVTAMYFLSVPGKYLPGNIGHFIGRGVLLKAEGVSVKRSTVSFLFESGVLAAVAITITLAFAAPIRAIFTASEQISFLQIVVLLSLGVSAVVLISEACRWRGISLPSRRVMLQGVFFAASCNTLTFLLLGALTYSLMPSGTFGYFTATSTFALAFVAGFLVPGAPAGVGIREAVFIAVAPAEFRFAATAVIALLRVAQLVADLLTFLLGYYLRNLGKYQTHHFGTDTK